MTAPDPASLRARLSLLQETLRVVRDAHSILDEHGRATGVWFAPEEKP